jgi:hypothetical protein
MMKKSKAQTGYQGILNPFPVVANAGGGGAVGKVTYLDMILIWDKKSKIIEAVKVLKYPTLRVLLKGRLERNSQKNAYLCIH